MRFAFEFAKAIPETNFAIDRGEQLERPQGSPSGSVKSRGDAHMLFNDQKANLGGLGRGTDAPRRRF